MCARHTSRNLTHLELAIKIRSNGGSGAAADVSAAVAPRPMPRSVGYQRRVPQHRPRARLRHRTRRLALEDCRFSRVADASLVGIERPGTTHALDRARTVRPVTKNHRCAIAPTRARVLKHHGAPVQRDERRSMVAVLALVLVVIAAGGASALACLARFRGSPGPWGDARKPPGAWGDRRGPMARRGPVAGGAGDRRT